MICTRKPLHVHGKTTGGGCSPRQPVVFPLYLPPPLGEGRGRGVNDIVFYAIIAIPVGAFVIDSSDRFRYPTRPDSIIMNPEPTGCDSSTT
jgi:hypothetical protein